MKHTISAVGCAALVLSLTACGGGDDKSTLPSSTGGSSPSTTTSSQPKTSPPTATPTATRQAALAAHSTYNYNGMTLVVNLPAKIPSASRFSMRRFSDFLQAKGRSTARNRLDPAVAGLASEEVMKYVRSTTRDGLPSTTGPMETVKGIGSVTYTVSTIHQAPHAGPTMVTGCLDQSNLLQVRKDGSQYDDTGPNVSTLKMSATIFRGMTERFTLTRGQC